MKGSGINELRPKRGWGAARRVGVSIVVAVSIALVGSRVNPVNAGGGADVDVEDVLRRPIRNAEIDMRSLRAALESLGRAAGVRITVEDLWPDTEDYRVNGEFGPRLRVVDQSLGRALGRVLAEFDTPGTELSFEVQHDGILVGLDTRVGDSTEVRAYDVRDLLRIPRRGERRVGCIVGEAVAFQTDPHQEGADLMVRAVTAFISPTRWAVNSGGRGMNVCTIGNSLVVTAAPRAHRDVARLLFLLRHPAVPGRTAERAERR
jgi:hypothetical protein